MRYTQITHINHENNKICLESNSSYDFNLIYKKSFPCMDKVLCCGISTIPFEIPHKISYSYIKIYLLYSEINLRGVVF